MANFLLGNLSLVLLVTLSSLSCSKQNDASVDAIDRAPEVFEKLSSQTFMMDTSEFKMTGPNTFNLRYDTRITVQQKLSANCVVDMSGTTVFLESPSSEFKYHAQFNILNAKALSATPHSGTTDSMMICTLFAESLMKQTHFEQKIFDLTGEYISFAKLDFSMPDPDLMKSIYSETNHTRVSDFTIEIGDQRREYFLKDGASVDLTEISLYETRGHYRMINNQSVSLQLLVGNDSLTFSSSNCKFNYEFKVKRVFLDKKGLWFELNLKSQTPSSIESVTCTFWDANIKDLSSRKLEWGYSIEPRYLKSAIFMRFPSPNSGSDRIEAFVHWQ